MKPIRLFLAALFSLTALIVPAQACERDKTAASCQSGYVWDEESHDCIAVVSS